MVRGFPLKVPAMRIERSKFTSYSVKRMASAVALPNRETGRQSQWLRSLKRRLTFCPLSSLTSACAHYQPYMDLTERAVEEMTRRFPDYRFQRHDLGDVLPPELAGRFDLATAFVALHLLLLASAQKAFSGRVCLGVAETIVQTWLPTLIERDNNVPPLADLLAEARRAEAVMNSIRKAA